MAKKIKVMTVIGTRPEIIKLSRVMSKLDRYVNHIIVSTGQSYDYELNKIFFEDLGIRKPDYFLDVKSETLGGQLANIFSRGEEVLQKENPEALLVLGDTNSTLISILAKRFKIPIFHMEAGNRCFDENVPEEINRKIVDHISDINLPYTENSRHYLIQEGIHPGTIFVTGSPLPEVLHYYKEKIENSGILKKLNILAQEYFLVSIHREENISDKDRLFKLIESLNAVAEKYKKPVIVSLHPRTKKMLEEYNLKTLSQIKFQKPFGYFDYVFLQKNALCVLSDSGTIPEEAAILHFPALQIRTSSERPEAFDTGNIILTGLKKEIILESIETVIAQLKKGERFQTPRDYQDLNVSGKVLRLILGLADIVKIRKTAF